MSKKNPILVLWFWAAFLLLPCHANADPKQIWIQAVGIDQTTHTQNFEYFYSSARDFLDLCEKSPVHPDCHLFMNPDTSLANDPKYAATQKIPADTPTPTPQSIIAFLKESLKKSTAGDTIILSLQNHGAPSKRGNSCVWLSTYDYLCENDLKKILQPKPKGLLPPGVKVLLNADACFTGAFVDLASKNVCVTTWSDRRSVGAGAEAGKGRLWQEILEHNPSTLADLRKSMRDGYRNVATMGSQSMTSIMCKDLRMKNGRDEDTQSYYFSEAQCKADAEDIYGYMSISDNVWNTRFTKFIEQAIDPITCVAAGFSNKTCTDLELLQSDGFKNEFTALKALSDKRLVVHEALLTFTKPSIPTTTDQANGLRTALTLAWLKPPVDYNFLFSQFSPADQQVLKNEVVRIQNRYKELLQEQDNAEKAYLEKFIEVLDSPYKAAWNAVDVCFFDVESTYKNDNLSKEYVPGSGNFPRKFTEQDIQEAEACEASIKFQ